MVTTGVLKCEAVLEVLVGPGGEVVGRDVEEDLVDRLAEQGCTRKGHLTTRWS